MNAGRMLGMALAVAVGATALVGGAGAVTAKSAKPASGKTAQVDRGRYLVAIMGCNDCHTPWHMGAKGPEPDMARMLSGHSQDFKVEAPATIQGGAWMAAVAPTMTAWSGPWGVSFTANLTPDKETGLGKWTPETFIATIRNGKHEGQGRDLLPPMPWPQIRNATDDDLRAIFAYLQSIPAISNKVPQPLEPAQGGN